MPGEMMAYGSRISLDYMVGRALAHTGPIDTYLALLTAYPAYDDEIADFAEVNAGIGYARPQVAWGPASAAEPSVIGNSGLLSFGALTADMPAPAVAVALVTVQAGTAGQALFRWSLDPSAQMQLNTGQSLQIAPGKITISL